MKRFTFQNRTNVLCSKISVVNCWFLPGGKTFYVSYFTKVFPIKKWYLVQFICIIKGNLQNHSQKNHFSRRQLCVEISTRTIRRCLQESGFRRCIAWKITHVSKKKKYIKNRLQCATEMLKKCSSFLEQSFQELRI